MLIQFTYSTNILTSYSALWRQAPEGRKIEPPAAQKPAEQVGVAGSDSRPIAIAGSDSCLSGAGSNSRSAMSDHGDLGSTPVHLKKGKKRKVESNVNKASMPKQLNFELYQNLKPVGGSELRLVDD